MPDKIILMGYGLFLLVGGYIGFTKGGSKVSLIMGTVSAALVFLGVCLMGSNPKGGLVLLNCVSGVLAVVFLMRVLKTHAFMPSGMLMVVSLAVLVFCLMRLTRLS